MSDAKAIDSLTVGNARYIKLELLEKTADIYDLREIEVLGRLTMLWIPGMRISLITVDLRSGNRLSFRIRISRILRYGGIKRFGKTT